MAKVKNCIDCGLSITKDADRCKPCGYKNRKHPGHSPETKKKIGLALKGRKYTPDTRKIYSQAMYKRWQNPEYRKRMSEVHKGFKPSKETLEKLSRIRKGIKRSQVWKDNISKSKQDIPLSIRINMSNGKKGDKNGMWRGGVTPKNRRARGSIEYKEWRKAIFKRDDYTCQFCKVRGVTLHADHIKPFSLYPELRYEVSNGRTLCIACHRSTDTYGVNYYLNDYHLLWTKS